MAIKYNFNFKKFNKILLFLIIFFSSSGFSVKKIHALPLPFQFMMKPYIGVDLLLGGQVLGKHTATRESFTNSIYQFYNMQFNAGLRVHRNFGFEAFVSRWNYKISVPENSSAGLKTDNFGLTANFYLQLPFTNFLEMFGTNIEFYGLVGFGVLTGKTTDFSTATSFTQVAPRFGGGIQLRVLDTFALKFGVDYYQMNVPGDKANIGNIMFYNLGFSFFFL